MINFNQFSESLSYFCIHLRRNSVFTHFCRIFFIANLRTLGKFLDPQILLGERSGTFRYSGQAYYSKTQVTTADLVMPQTMVVSLLSWSPHSVLPQSTTFPKLFPTPVCQQSAPYPAVSAPAPSWRLAAWPPSQRIELQRWTGIHQCDASQKPC